MTNTHVSDTDRSDRQVRYKHTHTCPSPQERGHSHAWRLVAGDASQPDTWQQVATALPKQHSLAQQHCFVLMMEVLDNLPHDRRVVYVAALGNYLHLLTDKL